MCTCASLSNFGRVDKLLRWLTVVVVVGVVVVVVVVVAAIAVMAVMLNRTRTLRKPYLSVATAFLHVLGHSLSCSHDLLGRLTRRFPCTVHEIRGMAAWRRQRLRLRWWR